jgi:hypothetical protein
MGLSWKYFLDVHIVVVDERALMIEALSQIAPPVEEKLDEKHFFF